MAIKVGIAPDSWGVWFPKHEAQPPFERCLNEMKEAGYAGLELGPWGYFPNTSERLKKELDSRELTLVAATTGGDFLRDASIEEMCRTIDEIAVLLRQFSEAKYIVLLPNMYTDLQTGEQLMNPILDSAQWEIYCKNVEKAVLHTVALGFTAVFHPHVDSHVQTEEQIEQLLRDTDVQLCLDTGHHVYGGGEPISFYKKHANRIPYIHIKDCDLAVKKRMDEEQWSFAKAVTEDIMVAPGEGSINLEKLHEALGEMHYDGWVVVEQDLFPVKSFDIPFPVAERGRQNLKKAGFQ
ncbi:MAG: sugar phosphate isomerase/epimerase family protein [Lachnospiraceae bacterium]